MPHAATTDAPSADPEPEEQPPSCASRTTAFNAAAVELSILTDPDITQTIDHDWLSDQLIAVLGHLARPVARVEVRVTSDREMMRLHRVHLQDGSTTDVITFDLTDDETSPIEASIVICADEAARCAVEHGHTLERELLLYALHGLLHCTGYDDHDEASHARMHAEEDRILTLIGVGATYSGETKRSTPGGER